MCKYYCFFLLKHVFNVHIQSFWKAFHNGAMKKSFNNGIYRNLVVVGEKKLVFLKSYNCGFLVFFTNVEISFCICLFTLWFLDFLYYWENVWRRSYCSPRAWLLMLVCPSLQSSFSKDVQKHLSTSYAIFLMPSTAFHVYRARSLLLFFPSCSFCLFLFLSPFFCRLFAV